MSEEEIDIKDIKKDFDEDLAKKCVETSVNIVKGKLCTTDKIKQHIRENYSYEELILLATGYLQDETERALKQNPLISLLMKIRDMEDTD